LPAVDQFAGTDTRIEFLPSAASSIRPSVKSSQKWTYVVPQLLWEDND
jgi:hypothetical protein